MVKALAESHRPFGGSDKLSRLMTNITRNHSGGGTGCVTFKTSNMSRAAGRDRECRAIPAGSFVTCRTVRTAVLGMIELDGKTPQPGKSLQPCICMTDRAHRAGVARKLIRVTAGARKMAVLSGKANARRIIITAVTQQTRQTRMRRVTVLEF